MELKEIILKIHSNKVTEEEIMSWKSSKNNFNLWHAMAMAKNATAFDKISSIVNKTYLLQKINEKNELGDYPAHIATWAENLDVLKTIAKYAGNLDFTDAAGRNIAMIALQTKNKEIIQFSLNNTSNIHQQDNKQKTLLHYAEKHTDATTYQKIEQMGVNPSLLDKLGKAAHCPENQEEENIAEFVAKKKIMV